MMTPGNEASPEPWQHSKAPSPKTIIHIADFKIYANESELQWNPWKDPCDDISLACNPSEQALTAACGTIYKISPGKGTDCKACEQNLKMLNFKVNQTVSTLAHLSAKFTSRGGRPDRGLNSSASNWVADADFSVSAREEWFPCVWCRDPGVAGKDGSSFVSSSTFIIWPSKYRWSNSRALIPHRGVIDS